MRLQRRQFLQLGAAHGAAAAAPAFWRRASAIDYPVRPVRLIVGFPAGGPQDIVARLMGQWLGERLGQQFIIDNRSGADGNIGADAVVHAARDGYTLLLCGSPNAINASLYDNLNFVFLRDLAPVAGIARVPLVMEVNPSLPVMTVPQFIAYAKTHARPDQFCFRRHRQPAACRGRTVQADGRHQHDPRALSRRGAGAHRPARRAGPGHA